jgi:hypothetical protein
VDPVLRTPPKDATHFPYNAGTGFVTAYNGATIPGQYSATDSPPLQSRTVPTCVPVTAEQIQSRMKNILSITIWVNLCIVPGWPKLSAAADAKWGTGHRTVVTNPIQVGLPQSDSFRVLFNC